jgi:diguanylate cyclase (GGDEF)-like protein
MANHCTEHSTNPGTAGRGMGVGALIAPVALAVACAVGLFFVVTGVAGPDLEWRTLSLAVLAVALRPLSADVRAAGGERIRFPLSHVVLFAGILALGPGGAALCAVFHGIGTLVFSPGADRSIQRAVVTVFRPAGVCATAGLVFQATGGSSSHPYDVASILPAAYSAAAYALLGALLTAASCRIKKFEPRPVPRRVSVASAWLACFSGGYMLAALYSVAPTYVLLVPVATVGLVHAAGRREAGTPADPERAPETAPERAEDTAVFLDPSTGLANRRYLELFIRGELGRSERMGKRMSLAVFDIDGLTRLTDSRGSEPVECAVREIASRLKTGLRDYDVLARYSAGRIAAVLPEIGPEQALEVAERLHRLLESVRLGDAPVSVSVGIASFPEHASTVEDLINSAHHALNRGRFQRANSVCVCERLDRAS